MPSLQMELLQQQNYNMEVVETIGIWITVFLVINASGAGTYTYSVWVKAPDDQPDDYYGCRMLS